MAQLFKKNILKEKLQNFEIPDFEEKIDLVKKWHIYYHKGTLKTDKEISVAPDWTKDFLGNILNYTGTSDEKYTYAVEYTIAGQRPDFVLGYFDIEKSFVIGELKGVKISLDTPQKGHGSITPVQQAFKYKGGLRDSSFVIVSNFFETRLYYDNHLDYEIWTLDDLVNPKNNYFNFRKFYYLLSEKNLITKKGDSNTKSLLSFTRIKEKEITKQFYKEYTILRKELFKDIISNNSFKKSELDFVLNKTQKIIDRIIFIHFCEDLGLLPNGVLGKKVKKAEDLGFAPWEMVKKFFEFVDVGHEDLDNDGGYNGGLFKEDKELNNLKVGDKICKKFVELGDYDFEDDLSVNILGHIFEQSISDIEELKDKINKEEEVSLSKRKKDGVFYTPEYIVDYIVKNSVGKKIEDWEDELKEKHKLKEDINDKNYIKRAILVYSELQEKVQNIKVIDPACGSGAFLVKVFDYLFDKNKEIANKIIDLRGGSKQIGLEQSDSYFKSILQNNIFGVDLNEESVEISKLSLWLKTASKGKKLANLDGNIKCGNSLIDDKEIAGDKAFVWETEFKEIFDNGGFDVVIGNPPYVTTSLGKGFSSEEEITNFYKNKYELSSAYKVNLYLMFLELGTKLLNKSGIVSYIIPNTIYLNYYYSNFRKYLIENFYLKILFNLEYEVFDDADIGGLAILVIEKSIKGNTILKNSKNIDSFNSPYENIINQELFLSIPNNKFIFSIESVKLWNKSFNNSITLGGGDFQFYNGIKSGNNKKFLSLNKIDNNYKEVIRGRDFYKYTVLNYEFFIKYIPEELWSNTNPKMYYVDEKLIFRQTSDHLVVSYDNKQLLTMDTTHICFPLNKNIKTKYVLSVLNSKLLNFLYQIIVPEIGKTFSEVKIVNLKQLPIKNISLSKQTPFIEKADFMLNKNKELGEKVSKFLKRLNSSFEIEKLSNKLKIFYELEFSEFVKELKKKKVSMSLVEQDEWEEYFDSYKSVIVELKSEIDKCDSEIDDMVFELYGLSEQERKVITESLKK